MATERPILLLPEPAKAEREEAGRGGTEKIQLPSPGRQGERIGPQMTRLESVYKTDQAHFQASPGGAMPEHVLVLETIGGVDDFVVAVRNTPGLEWLGEYEEEDIPPDDDFYKTKEDGTKRDGEGLLKGRLYLVMTNHAAMHQILSLWHNYSTKKAFTFPHGQTKWRDIFKRLRDIRMWGVEDRLRETGVLEDWQHRLDQKEKRVRFEIEIWFRQDAESRKGREREVRKLITARKGRIISAAVIEEIAYHAVLAELPIQEIQSVVEHLGSDGDLIKCEQIMFFRPTGQCAVAARRWRDVSG